MSRRRLQHALVPLVLLAGAACVPGPSAAAPSSPARLALVEAGRPAASIVRPDSAGAWELEAAEDLARLLRRMTGAEFRLVPEAECSPGPAVHVGWTRRARAELTLPPDLAPDGYLIETRGDALFLAGRNPWGTAYAVADFLERCGGVRWYFPGPLGEIVPARRELVVPPLREIEQPDFAVRDFVYAQVWGPGAPRLHEEFRRWAWHNRVAVQGDTLGPWGPYARHPQHSFFRHFPPAGRDSLPPDFFALVGGERVKPAGDTNWQLCTTHPGVIEALARLAPESFQRDPRRPLFSVSPNDLGGFCECDRCRALDPPREKEALPPAVGDLVRRAQARVTGQPADQVDSPLSTRVFTLASEVARRAPEATIGCYAYAGYHRAPRDLAWPPNLEIWYCQSCGSFENPLVRRRARRELREWLELPAPVYVYEYYGHFRARTPRFFPRLIADDLRSLQETGVRGVHSEATCDWAIQGINYYAAARLLWDASRDADSLLADYVSGLFGPAAAPMRDYVERLETIWLAASRRGAVGASTLEEAVEPFTTEVLEELEGELADARRKAAGDDRERVDLFARGLFYPRLYRDAEPVGSAFRRDREAMGVLVARSDQSSYRAPARAPGQSDSDARAAARALGEREERFLADLWGSPALCRSSLETTDREYEGWMGEQSVRFLAWKYWPDYAAGTPAAGGGEIQPALERRLAERERGGNRAREPGVAVSVESRLRPAFAAEAVRDGERGGRGWASAEGSRAYAPQRPWSDFAPRWVELAWPRPVELGAVVVYWGERGAYWTSRSYELQTWTGRDWEPLVRVTGSREERATAHLFPPQGVTRLRLWQSGDGGPPLRPNLLWVREIECY